MSMEFFSMSDAFELWNAAADDFFSLFLSFYHANYFLQIVFVSECVLYKYDKREWQNQIEKNILFLFFIAMRVVKEWWSIPKNWLCESKVRTSCPGKLGIKLLSREFGRWEKTFQSDDGGRSLCAGKSSDSLGLIIRSDYLVSVSSTELAKISFLEALNINSQAIHQ